MKLPDITGRGSLMVKSTLWTSFTVLEVSRKMEDKLKAVYESNIIGQSTVRSIIGIIKLNGTSVGHVAFDSHPRYNNGVGVYVGNSTIIIRV